jgi:electron transfer flavoprotein alpha subunit
MNDQSIWVIFLEDQNNQNYPWNLLSAAKDLTTNASFSIEVYYIGQYSEQFINQAKQYGVKTINFIESEGSDNFYLDSTADILTQLARQNNPKIILLGEGEQERELAAACSVDLNACFFPAVNSICYIDDLLQTKRLAIAGKVIEKIEINSFPVFISLNRKSYPFPEFNPDELNQETRVVGKIQASKDIQIIETVPLKSKIPLDQARVLVAGGRGLIDNPSSPQKLTENQDINHWRVNQGLQLLDELAGLLGGTIAASRSIVDSGYAPYELQVGQTGKMVSPDLYIACGISGAIQHTIGMSSSKVIVAINKDANAPIFKSAHYGIVGSLYDVIPAWINHLKTND